MRRLNVMRIIILFVSIFLIISCRRKYQRYLVIENNSNNTVYFFTLEDQDFNFIYPDTSLVNSSIERNIVVEPKATHAIFGEWPVNLDQIYQGKTINDTISMVVVSEDKLLNNSWDSVAADYNINIRYDLSLDDLEKRDFVIEYPYNPTLGELKVYERE